MENKKMIYESMCKIMSEVTAIKKEGKNTQQGYKFRGIDDMYNALHDIFAKNNVFITSEVMESVREERKSKTGGLLMYAILTVKHTFHAIDGSTVSSIMIGEAMDSGDKASNKAMSGALKYSLMQILLIPTNEKLDTENESPEPAPREKYNIEPHKKAIDDAKDINMLKAIRNKLGTEKNRMSQDQVDELVNRLSIRTSELVADKVDGEVTA